MKEVTVKHIILTFIRTRGKDSFFLRNSSVETVIQQFGKERFNVCHSPGTYGRAWREMRETNELKLHDYDVIEPDTNQLPTQLKDSKEKIFLVRKIKRSIEIIDAA